MVLTVRADYYGRFAGDQRLASAIAANQVLVGPMTAEEYRRAITRPAQRHGVTVEPELVDALVDEVTGQPGALPLLSTALVELWEARADRTMTPRVLPGHRRPARRGRPAGRVRLRRPWTPTSSRPPAGCSCG